MSESVLRAHEVSTLKGRVKVLGWLAGNRVGGTRDPLMRRLGLLVTEMCPPRDDICELKTIFDFVVKNVRYTGDIAGKDTFQTALRTLQFGGGDCDDHAVLCSVLAAENGFDTKWRITSNTGSSWDHIYCMAATRYGSKRWIALDTTLGPGKFGVEPRRAKYEDFIVGDFTK